MNKTKPILGVDYYPEHWPEERWSQDAALMREVGLSIVRVGEFAWSRLEPADNQFKWDWLERAISILEAENLQIILGTPSTAPPAWLCTAHPEVLAVTAEGDRVSFGGRRHYCPSSSTYRAYVERILRAEAEHFRDNQALVGWQIDNEMGNHGNTRCFCPSCEANWHNWLSNRYHSLEKLNETWGTVFWSQEYSAWDQIPLPRPALINHSPSLQLDYYRFASDIATDFVNHQVSILREYFSDPARHFITTNIFYGEDNINFYDMFRRTNFPSWDNYPHGMQAVSDIAYYHDFMWGLKNKPYWVMEQQLGQINWTNYNPPVPPGLARLWTYQDFLKGTEACVYFRWRESRFGQEQYHSAFLRHDASLNRVFGEIQATARELALLPADLWVRSPASVALLFSYDDLWAIQIEPHNIDFDYLQLIKNFHASLWQRGIACDVIPRKTSSQKLSNYNLVITLASLISDIEEDQEWKDYVANGGKLLSVMRGSVKQSGNVWVDKPTPANLNELFGMTVGEILSFPPPNSAILSTATRLGDTSTSDILPLALISSKAQRLEGRRIWAEVLENQSAETLLTYGSNSPLDYFESGSALTSHKYGNGVAYYLGVWPEESLFNYLWDELFSEDLITILPRSVTLPEKVEAIRCGDRGQYVALLNHNEIPVKMDLDFPLSPIIGFEMASNNSQTSLTLPAYGIAIFSQT